MATCATSPWRVTSCQCRLLTPLGASNAGPSLLRPRDLRGLPAEKTGSEQAGKRCYKSLDRMHRRWCFTLRCRKDDYEGMQWVQYTVLRVAPVDLQVEAGVVKPEMQRKVMAVRRCGRVMCSKVCNEPYGRSLVSHITGQEFNSSGTTWCIRVSTRGLTRIMSQNSHVGVSACFGRY